MKEENLERLIHLFRMLNFHLDNDDENNNDNNEPQENPELRDVERFNIQIIPINNDIYDDISTIEKIFYTIGFILIGNTSFIIKKYKIHYYCPISIAYYLFNIIFLFPLIYSNIITLIFAIIFSGFKQFILAIKDGQQNGTKQAILIVVSFFTGIFCLLFMNYKKIIHDTFLFSVSSEIIITFFPCFFISFFVFFPSILAFNYIYMIILLIKERNFKDFLHELDYIFEESFGYSVLSLNNIF